MRVFLSGSRAFGADAFALLVRLGHEVAGVAVEADGDRLAIAAWAAAVPVRRWGNWAALPPALDLIICAHSFDIVPPHALAAARLGGIGYHPSLLPRHKGRRAVEATIAAGDVWAGGSIYRLSESIDGGDVLARDAVRVEPGEDARALWRRALHPLGLRLLEAVLTGLVAEGAEEAGDWPSGPLLERY